jgi:GNAT superfamily N-acetyltransferase
MSIGRNKIEIILANMFLAVLILLFSVLPSAFARTVREIPRMTVNIFPTDDEDLRIELAFILRDAGITNTQEFEEEVFSMEDPYEDYEAVVAIDKKTDDVIGGFFYKIDHGVSLDIVYIELFLGVAPAYQRNGVREELFEELVEIMREARYRGFRFYSKEQSVRFYKSQGAKEVEGTRDEYGTDMEYIIES